MIDYQFAALMIQRVLLPLRAEVCKQLDELTKLKQHSQWLNLLLTNYVLLDSLGRLMRQQRDFAEQNEFEVSLTLLSQIRKCPFLTIFRLFLWYSLYILLRHKLE